MAAAGLSTGGAYAADLGVLTSLDVCDALGLSGLTISSDTNCLQITGEVKYKFTWGDFDDEDLVIDSPNGGVAFFGGDGENDWRSRFDAWIKFVATADSDFGPAKAVLKLKQVTDARVDDEGVKYYGGSTTGDGGTVFDPGGNPIGTVSGPGSVVLDEAYVSIGDSTVIMAGKKGSIMNKGDDEPLTWLDLFNSEDVDRGVSWGPLPSSEGLDDGGMVIQVTSDLGNGFTLSAGLENLDGAQTAPFGLGGAGTAVGVIAYAGEGISAHITGAAAGVLDGEVEAWGVHAGFAGTFDNFKVVLAGAYGHDEVGVINDYWNVLASASATFDMFTIAGAVEAVDLDGDTDFGASGSISVAATEGVTINVGGRWYQSNIAGQGDSYQVAAGVSAAVTESITLTGEVGYVNGDFDELFYGSAKLAWAPGGGYTSSIKGTVTSGTDDQDLGYKIESEFKKTFE
ncbi:hypothetical protein VW23_022965 [Devosia insulae DS-56]|uniref:Porin domain-containing protein n=1 Tax=Devosia insulae DS-56 TaxID=1116389 RepID=A0A1E5XNH0_9HYPH|nr:hypothetical protein VW23_022965 [Devosia insulae DS-56]